jgi:hypothetical protein
MKIPFSVNTTMLREKFNSVEQPRYGVGKFNVMPPQILYLEEENFDECHRQYLKEGRFNSMLQPRSGEEHSTECHSIR